MPHFLADDIQDIQTPIVSNSIKFDFVASNGFEKLIGVEHKNKQFLLVQRTKRDKILVKYEKFTRVSPVSIVKDAIKEYAKVANATIATHNLEDRQVKRSIENFKNIDFFINDYSYEKEIWIEVGFGSGRHLLKQAKDNPNVQFIGLEIHKPSIEQVLGQIDIQGLDNIYVIDYDARLFMEFLKSNSVGRIFVHFPVPWDKKPHRRVYSKEFIQESMRVLKVDGTLELRTDSDNYYEYVTSLYNELDLKVDIRQNQDLEVSSKYEDRWKKQQKNIYDVIFSNKTVSENVKIEYNFIFEKSNIFDKIKQISKETFVEDGFFVHFKDFYEIDQNNGLINVSFGSFNRPENKYIFVSGNSARYFPYLPIPSKHNYLAHQKIEKLINE